MNDRFIQGISINWEKVDKRSYIRKISAIKNIEKLSFNNDITFFVGENGSGKSTLLEAIAVAYGFNAEGGTKNYHFSTYNSHSELCDAIKLSKGYKMAKTGYFLRAESFYNVVTKEMDYADFMHPSKGLHKKSHGESFLEIAQDYLSARGIYILDEPEAALSPQRQLTLLLEIYNSVKKGSQFIIATHSPILLAIPDSEILSFDGGKVHRCEYEDTDSYQITKMFIENRKQILDNLLNN